MAYKNKAYVCFDGDSDIRFYYLMKAWKQNDNTDFNFYDAHDLNTARDSSTEESIKKQLKIRLDNSKVFIVLVGEKTKNLYKFVRWELEQALSRDLPIIVVNINGLKKRDDERCPPIIKNELAIHIPFKPKILQYALENWPESHTKHKKAGETGAYFYPDSTYTSLNIE